MEHHVTADIKFSIIPEWVLDADISDRALRIYAILARYADSETLQAFPSRDTLGKRAYCNVKAVTKAVDELVAIGAVIKQHRKHGDAFQSNLYTLRRVGSNLTLGRDTSDPRVGSNLTLGRVSDDPLTRTTELEPLNNIKRASKLGDYEPPVELRQHLSDKYPALDYQDTWEAFYDHHTAKGSTFKDWDSAVRTWWRNAQKWSEPKTVIHKQETKPPAEGPGRRDWVRKLHDEGEHFECQPGEFGCK